MPISTVLLDLDGVVRHFDPLHLRTVEERHDLEPGALAAVGFSPPLIDPVVTGRTTRSAWVAEVGEAIGNPAAAREWLSEPGRIDWDVMNVVDELRSLGTRVAVLTNGTDTIPQEMAAFGITDRFDGIFNSAEIGFAKPDRRAFLHVCERLDVAASEVFFTDDSGSKLAGAIEIGMTARRYEGFELFQRHLDEYVR